MSESKVSNDEDMKKQIQLIWAVLLRLPRLEGALDTIMLEANKQDTMPMLPEDLSHLVKRKT